ncbi:MAG: HmuY family protein [Pseudomonadota bacterium]
MRRFGRTRLFAVSALAVVACGPDDRPVSASGENSGPGGGSGSGGEGNELRIRVSASATTLVRLATPEVIDVDGTPDESLEWDLAFQGWDVFTNGGVSGPGSGAAFGPLPTFYLLFPDEPLDVPFLIADRTGGAFVGWYAYGGGAHSVYSRHHVYGIETGDRRYKLQILGYYGDVEGVPVSALYRIRYAEVTEDGVGPTELVENLDATANGAPTDPDEPSGCLALASGKTLALTPDEMRSSTAWDLCFRRDAVSVNGELGGPGDVSAVDLDAAETEDETLDEVRERTAESELPRFEAVDHAALTARHLEYRGDRVTSAFTNKWFDRSTREPRLDVAWYVVGADGRSKYFVAFTGVEDAKGDAPGTIVLRVVPVPSTR